MGTENDICLHGGFLLGLIATLAIKRAEDGILAFAALAARGALDISANRLCRGDSLQVQTQRLASGRIVGFAGLPKRRCGAVWQTMPRFLAQFVGRDEDDNTMRDALPLRLLLAGFLCRIRLLGLLDVIDDTNASSLGLTDASRDTDRLQHRASVARVILDRDRHLPSDCGAQQVTRNLDRQRARLLGCTRIELIDNRAAKLTHALASSRFRPAPDH
ncbi:hypothetical protein ACFKHW_08120 [Bradyrhizobium lupini]|uniref:hypothetical protein n=1 Tax=Rhizobium lupini TaxID=136996 RepID=UPI00366F31E5